MAYCMWVQQSPSMAPEADSNEQACLYESTTVQRLCMSKCMLSGMVCGLLPDGHLLKW